MKNIKTLCLVAFAMIFVATTFSSCKKWKASRRIDGTWKITSYTEDGEELIGSVYTVAEFDFDKSDKESGDFELDVTDVYGYRGVFSGTYECKDKAEELTLTLISPETAIWNFDMELEKEDMTLSGNINGYSIRFEAKKD